jgi:hypothetical protein
MSAFLFLDAIRYEILEQNRFRLILCDINRLFVDVRQVFERAKCDIRSIFSFGLEIKDHIVTKYHIKSSEEYFYLDPFKRSFYDGFCIYSFKPEEYLKKVYICIKDNFETSRLYGDVSHAIILKIKSSALPNIVLSLDENDIDYELVRIESNSVQRVLSETTKFSDISRKIIQRTLKKREKVEQKCQEININYL